MQAMASSPQSVQGTLASRVHVRHKEWLVVTKNRQQEQIEVERSSFHNKSLKNTETSPECCNRNDSTAPEFTVLLLFEGTRHG